MNRYSTGVKTKQKLFDTFEEYFYEKGYDDTTIRDICDVANINKGAFYYYYKSKFEIGWEVCKVLGRGCASITDTLIAGKDVDPLLPYITHSKIFWKVLSQDIKLQKFNVEVTRHFTIENNYDTSVHDFPQKISGEKLPQNELELISQVDVGVKFKLMSMMLEDSIKYNWKMVSDFGIHTYLNFFGIEKHLIDEIIVQVEECLKDHVIKNDKFNIFLER